jgi:threonine/homoserine/homoserine lactone efflux protein
MRTRAGVALQMGTAQRSTGMTFLRATLTCLMNPKAYVFMLAVVPQFLRPAAGPVWLQACALSAITAATQAGVYGGLALLSVRAGAWLGGNPDKAAVVARLIGGMLALSALVAGVQGWQQTAAAG